VREAVNRPASGAGPKIGGPDGQPAREIGRQVALDRIRVPVNVRTLDDAHVEALAGSIRLQGMLVPVVVRDDGENGFELVAGFHRVATGQVARAVRGAGRGARRADRCRPRGRERHVMPTSA
jgi:hypothetical protein